VYSLLRLLNKVNTLLDVALKVLVAGLKELLLLVVCLADNINGLLGTVGLFKVSDSSKNVQSFTYAELNRDGEEIDASGLLNSITTLNTGQVDEAGLDDALLALGSLQKLLGETTHCQLVGII
jgi:hypothetical protein